MWKKNNYGFTLIELLVVISIIGFLVSAAVVAINNARAKSRDAKRIADITAIQKALEMYYDKHLTYPSTGSYNENTGSGVCALWDCSTDDLDSDGKYFLDVLEDEGFLPKVPVDPINNSVYRYRYYYYPSGTYGASCPAPGYILRVDKLETPIGTSTPCYWSGVDKYLYFVAGGQK